MKKAELFTLVIIIITFLISIYVYPGFPDKIAAHWDIEGKADGYMDKFWGLFLIPFIGVVLLLLFLAIPRIDPLKHNIKKFRGYFDAFITIIFVFFLYLQLLVIFWNMGAIFNMVQAISPAFGILFFFMGMLMEKAKRNWFIGIRTPWTMSSDRVWNKTHKKGGKMFKACGVLSFAGIFIPMYAIWLILVPVIVSAVYLIVYSYLEYKK